MTIIKGDKSLDEINHNWIPLLVPAVFFWRMCVNMCLNLHKLKRLSFSLYIHAD